MPTSRAVSAIVSPSLSARQRPRSIRSPWICRRRGASISTAARRESESTRASSSRVPKGFVLLREEARGAHRYQLQRIRRLDETDPGTLQLLVMPDAGYDPNRHRSDEGMSERTLLGQDVRWFRSREQQADGRTVIVEDGVIDPNLDDAPHLRLHVVISSPDPERLSAFRAIADGLDWSP